MKIKTYEDGSARLLWDWRDIALTTADFEALREYFQAERVGKIRSVCVKLQRNCLPFFGCLLEVWLVFLRLLVTFCGSCGVRDLGE